MAIMDFRNPRFETRFGPVAPEYKQAGRLFCAGRCIRPPFARSGRKLACLLFASLLTCKLSAETLTDTQGRSIEVDILETSGDSVKVRRSDGYIFNIPFSNLNDASKQLLRARAETATAANKHGASNFERLNEILGLPLWQDANLWDDDAEGVAQRLGWPRESRTESLSSYRIYFGREPAPIAGARPHTAVLYGREGKVDYLSIMFANKGDSVGGRKIKDVKEALGLVNDAIQADEATVLDRFAPLGEPGRDAGGSRDLRERALRWDSDNATFWLAVVEDEYIALRIMPHELADNWGNPGKLSDATVRNNAQSNVRENDFGDVLITNIPMVNQGPKGYCVPATMERCLRYMGIRADMYALAMAGNTIVGGGTYVSEIIEGTSSLIRRSSRKMRTIQSGLSIKSIRRYIDDGQPVIWSMTSPTSYNDLADAITKKRAQASDPREWRKELRDVVKASPEVRHDPFKGHVCLIIGYNETTDEIAVSDSWGPRFELRWITEDEAAKVSDGRFYIIDF